MGAQKLDINIHFSGTRRGEGGRTNDEIYFVEMMNKGKNETADTTLLK